MRLPKIYDHFRQGQIFTIDEAREKLQTTGNTLRKRLSELASRGYIFPIRQGLYRVSSIGEPQARSASSPYVVASKLTPYCYIAFKSALQLHAGEVPPERDTVYIVSPTKFNAFTFEGRHFFWCQGPEPQGLEARPLLEGRVEVTVQVTNFEKTLIDCLKRPAHCPSLPELLRLSQRTNVSPDFDRILQYASDCQVAALFNRLGYFFERLEAYWDVPEEFLRCIERKMSRKQTEWPILGAGFSPVFAASAEANENALRMPTLPPRNRWKIQLSGFRGENPVPMSSDFGQIANP